MSVKFESVMAGDVLYDCRYEREGNTTMRRWSVWLLVVKEINHEAGWALVSWNGNPATKEFRGYFGRSNISRSRREDPRIVRQRKFEAARAVPTSREEKDHG